MRERDRYENIGQYLCDVFRELEDENYKVDVTGFRTTFHINISRYNKFYISNRENIIECLLTAISYMKSVNYNLYSIEASGVIGKIKLNIDYIIDDKQSYSTNKVEIIFCI